MPFGAGLVMGRLLTNSLLLELDTVGRRHTAIEEREGRWWALDLGSTNGTLLNGEPLSTAELRHGDTLELPWGLCLAVWFHEPSLDRHAAIEADVLAHPDDENRWRVWADWLMERGLPLGARLLGTTREVDGDARVLATMAGFFRGRWLEVEWRFGFPWRTVARAARGARPVGVLPPGGIPPGVTPGLLLTRLWEEPAFRFLRHLEVDVFSFHPGMRTGNGVGDVLEPLARVEGPSWLETLRIRTLPVTPLSESQRALFAEVKRRQPRLTTTPEALLHPAPHPR